MIKGEVMGKFISAILHYFRNILTHIGIGQSDYLDSIRIMDAWVNFCN